MITMRAHVQHFSLNKDSLSPEYTFVIFIENILSFSTTESITLYEESTNLCSEYNQLMQRSAYMHI